jgi:DNA-binding response OmpR family regulator
VQSRARRILVVEDEALIAMLVEDMLGDLGYEAVGPALDLSEALSLAAQEAFDGAILDVNLNGEATFPVAQMLVERRIPFAFASGGAAEFKREFAAAPVLIKPFSLAQVRAVLTDLFDSHDTPITW